MFIRERTHSKEKEIDHHNGYEKFSPAIDQGFWFRLEQITENFTEAYFLLLNFSTEISTKLKNGYRNAARKTSTLIYMPLKCRV